MVKRQDNSNKNCTTIENKNSSNEIQNNNTIQMPLSFIKNNFVPFIPKNYKDSQNKEMKNSLEHFDINKKSRKNSSTSNQDNNSTSADLSPEKKEKEKEKEKNDIKKEEKVPFKCEAKDFKIKYKTELCKFYEINGKCKYGDKCAYAHGKENLRSKVTNTTAYRTKKCTQFFEKGYCPYGNRCQFAHQLKSNIINNPYDKGMSYTKIFDIISKMENVANIKKLVEKPRLPIFQEITNNNENDKKIGNRLFNDVKQIYKEGIYERIENND